MSNRILLACFNVVLATACLCAVAHGQKRVDSPLDQVKAQIRQKEFGPAIAALREYLNASVAGTADPNIDEAKRMLLQVSNTYAQSLEQSGDYLQSANVLLDTAAVAAFSEQSDSLLRDAKANLQRLFKAALAKKGISQATALADSYSKRFPSEAPLLDPNNRIKLQVDALAAMKNSARPSFVLREFKRLKSSGITAEQFLAAGIAESDLVARYAEELLSRGWFLQAASFAQAELSVGAPSSEVKSRLQKVSEKALSGYFESCQALGNAKMINDAAARYADAGNSGCDAAKATKMQAIAKRLAGKLEPKPLTFAAKFIEGKGEWSDEGTGYVISQAIQIGNCKNSRGGEWKEGQIAIQPGFCLENGILRASQGKLEIKGTPDRPAIFKRVTFECDYTASVNASNAVFIDCYFKKSGNWFWNGGFSSKWQLTDCLVVGSGFTSLTKIDYGIKLQRCTFVGVPFADRSLTDDAGKDNTGLYRFQWNTIADCQFYQCKVPPSLLWANGKSAFIDCTIGGNATFASNKPMDVEIYVPADDLPFSSSLKAATKVKGPGRVNYNVTAIEAAKLKRSSHWHFVPNLPDVTEDRHDGS